MKPHLHSTSLIVLTGALFIVSFSTGVLNADEDAAPAPSTPDKVEYRPTLLVQIRVADLERSVHFYRDLLDMKVVLRNDELRWVKVSHGMEGVTIGIGQGEDVKGSGTVSINLGVNDVDGARRLLEKRGIKFLAPTITVPGVVKLADLLDPDGNKIRLAEAITAESKGE